MNCTGLINMLFDLLLISAREAYIVLKIEWFDGKLVYIDASL